MKAWLELLSKVQRIACTQALLSVCGLALVAGCTSKPVSREDETTTDFRDISKVFYAIQNFQNRPPRDMEEIEKWLADLHKDGRNEEPQKVLTSSRDQQPYVIVLGTKLGSEPADALVIFEKNGIEGRRYVMNASGQVQQLTDDQFRQATIAKGKRSDES